MSPRLRHFLTGFAAGAAWLLASSAALADPASPAQAPRLRLEGLATRFDADRRLRDAGIARTAIERPVSGRGAAGVGFLCGVAPSDHASGGASALGADHDGRFLGAQFRLGFR